MSRCFPYPPPGFEKKATDDCRDLLAKEQHKEKKHKKEKRDREKKEGKERKHGDKSRHKHEEKKDRKERHRDKKRDEDKNRSFDDDRRIEGQTDYKEKGGGSIPKVEIKEIKDSTFAQESGRRIKDDKREANRTLSKVSISKTEEVEDSRFTKELAKRIKDENGGANRMLTKVGGISNSKADKVEDSRFIDELGKRIKVEKREPSRMVAKGGGISISKAEEVGDSRFTKELGKRIKDEKGEANKMLEKVSGLRNSKAEEVEDSRFTKELGRRMEIEKKVAANRMLENVTSSIPNRVEGLCTSTALQKERGNRNPMVTNFVRKEQTKATGVTRPVDRVNIDRTVFTNGNPVAASFIIKERKRNDGVGQPMEKDNHNHQTLSHRNPVASNFFSCEQRRVYGIPQALEKGIHNHQTLLQTPPEKYEVKSTECKENGKHQGASNKHGDSHSDRENEKRNKENGKNRDKEKRREEKKKKRENDRPKDGEKKDRVNNLDSNTVVSHSNNGSFAANNAQSNKRKEIEMNGFLHEHEASSKKLLKPASSIHQQNGRVIECVPIHAAHPSIRHGIPNSIKAEVMVNNKIHTIKDNEKKNKENGKNRDKEKRREEEEKKKKKKRENDEDNHKEHDQPKDGENKDRVNDLDFNTVVSHRNNGSFAANNAQNNKRKEFEMNGFLHEHEAPSNKLLKPASSIHQQKGRVIECDPIHAAHPSISHGIPNSTKTEAMMNNKIHTIKDSALAKAPPADLRPAKNGGKSKIITKLPHPDSKFLSQIYSIPKMEILPEEDNEEWLFSSSSHRPKSKEEFQGMKIESADVFALPYVIPY